MSGGHETNRMRMWLKEIMSASNFDESMTMEEAQRRLKIIGEYANNAYCYLPKEKVN